MTREQQLEYALAEIVEHLKGLHTILSTVMLDVAALRQTVLIEPSELGVYAGKLKAGAKTARPLLDTAMRSYDDILRRLQDLSARKNGTLDSLASDSTLLQ